MKQKLQIALFVGAMLSGVLNTPLQAATAQKPQSQASKKSSVAGGQEYSSSQKTGS